MFFVHPQIQLKDTIKAVSCLFRRSDVEKLKKQLGSLFPNRQIIFTDMGRTAFRLIVENLRLQNTEILMPAYICDIFYPILKEYNITGIFLDIDLQTFNIDIEQIEQKITPQTQAILISHTYGLLNNMAEILNLAKQYNLKVIEDAAHCFGGNVGNCSNVSFFSLYKQFPALRGGTLVCPKSWQIDLPKTKFNFRDFISFLNCFSLFAFLFKKFGSSIAPKIVRKEKLPESSAINMVSLNLFASFLPDFQRNLEKRKQLALFFQQELKKLGFKAQEPANNVFCFLSALMPEHLKDKRNELVQKLKKHKIFATRIWHTPIILNPETQKDYNINPSEFPNTTQAAQRIINFPLQNHYTEKHIKKMVDRLKIILE